jgi:peroxiredoxin
MAPEQNRQIPLSAGNPAPNFTLLNTDGAPFTLVEALQQRPVVVVFYRGDW